MQVEKTNIDIWDHDTQAYFKNKFLVHGDSRVWELFAKTKTERELWVEHFCKVIDVNAGKDVDFNKPSETYVKLQEAENGRSVTKYKPKKEALQSEQNGFE